MNKMSDAVENTIYRIVVFTLDEEKYALPLSSVNRVIHRVDIRKLPGAPGTVSGIINFHGQIIPVFDIRKKMGIPEKETDINDRIIISDTGKRKAALIADTVSEIRESDHEPGKPVTDLLLNSKQIKGTTKFEDGIILIYDLENFLSPDEEDELEKALKS